MRNAPSIFPFLSVFLLFSSCNKASLHYNQPYYPLVIGDSWTYDVTDSSMSTPNNQSPPQHYIVPVLISGLEWLSDGNQYEVWESLFPWGYDTNFVRLNADTIKIFDRTYSRTLTDLQYPRTTFLIPFKAGEGWNG